MKTCWLLVSLFVLIYGLEPAVAGPDADDRPTVALRLRYEQDYDRAVFGQMRRELRRLFRKSPARPAVTQTLLRNDVAVAKPSVMVRFHGHCGLDVTEQRRPRGPLGTTAVLRDRTAPFVDVYCDRVRDLIWPMLEREANHRHFFFGRALARILAHELHHAVNGSRGHDEKGLTRARLNPRELTMGSPVALINEMHVTPAEQLRPVSREILARGTSAFEQFGDREVELDVSYGTGE